MTPQSIAENTAYHAARLLLLVRLCGVPQGSGAKELPGIEGRTLLAKLDFFLRYPAYLKRAASILNVRLKNREFTDKDFGLEQPTDINAVESHMVRYLYGPWDFKYYLVLAYLIGKGLIRVEMKGHTEIFRLTTKGQQVAQKLAEDPSYIDIVSRAQTAYHLFNKFNGNRLKTFIYNNFPEVVNRRLRELI